MGISKLNPSAGGIPFGNTAGRPTAATGKLYSNGEEKRLELYTSNGWQNIISETPGIASVSGVYNESTGSVTLEISGTNFTTGAIASVIGTDGINVNASSTTVNSIISISAVFSGLSNANEPYDIKVTNTSTLFGILADALYINSSPVWTTAAGSLGTFNELVSVSLSATATDSDSTISYALAGGSTLPTGLSLNASTGAITGTLPDIGSNTTYTFTINASDGSNTVVPRTFSITSNAVPSITGGTLTSDSTYYYRTFTATGDLTVTVAPVAADILMVGAGGGGGRSLTGGGGGGAVGHFTSVQLQTGTSTVTIGAGGTTGGGGGTKGTATSFSTISLLGGGGAPNRDTANTWGQNNDTNGGANGGGSSADGPSRYNSRLGIAQSTPSGITGSIYSGFAGGIGSGGSTNYPGGGGGGANENGFQAASGSSNSAGGAGGAGKQINFGIHNLYWAGGGGGSSYIGGAGGGPGGVGGGGGGATNSGTAGSGGGSALNAGQAGASGGGDSSSNSAGGAGGVNTGGGGGGGAHGDGPGGAGGSGIFIIKYLKSAVGG